MLEGPATEEDVVRIVSILTTHLERHADKIAAVHTRPDGLEVCTKAIWSSFDTLCKELGPDWKLFPRAASKGPGRAAGEFLTDYQLFDKHGPRIACESELFFGGIEADFEKLCCVKSDIKIFIFECKHEDGLPQSILEVAHKYLTNFSHVYEGEAYVFMQLDGYKLRSFLWIAKRSGVIEDKREIVFKQLPGPA
jgi:hypothetical protein